MPNAQQAFKQLEAVMMPRTISDLTLKEQQLMHLQQTSGESVAEYASRVQQLAIELAQLGSAQNDEQIMARFLFNLRSFDASRRELLAATCSTLQQAITRAVSMETNDRLQQELKRGGRQQQQQPAGDDLLGSAHTAGLRGRSNSNTVKCFNCDQMGHIAKNCPAPSRQGRAGGRSGQSKKNITCNWCL